jgi:hypothetical protein
MTPNYAPKERDRRSGWRFEEINFKSRFWWEVDFDHSRSVKK